MQHASDRILKLMNRKTSRQELKDKIDMIRTRIPDATIRTTFIVGFPGETNEEFSQTLAYLKDLKLMHMHVFKYSPRKGTPAASMKDQVDPQMKQMRSDSLLALSTKNFRLFADQFKDTDLKVLFEEVDKDGYYEGLTDNYMRIKVRSDRDIRGQILPVRIEEICDDYCIGDLV